MKLKMKGSSTARSGCVAEQRALLVHSSCQLTVSPPTRVANAQDEQVADRCSLWQEAFERV